MTMTTDPFARLGAAMVRGRWVVLLLWLAIIGVAGGVFAPKANSIVKGGGFFVSKSESNDASVVLAGDFNASTRNNAVVTLHSDSLSVDDPAFQQNIGAAADRLSKVAHVRAVFTYANTLDPSFLSKDRHTTFAIVVMEGDEKQVQDLIPVLRDQLKAVTVEHRITGVPAINYDTQITSEKDLHRAEFFTIPIVLLLLILVFRTVITAMIPLVLGAASVVTTLALLYLIGSRTDVSVFALNVAAMIGLGLGIDFSLIVISRYREERAAGRTGADAVAATMATAGRSITYSGVTVIMAMLVLTLLLSDIMIVRSISLAIVLVAAAALFAGLTLLPAVLGILDYRVEWLRVMPQPRPADPTQPGFWYRLSHAIMRRPVVWLAVSLIVLLVLALPVRNIRLVGASTGVIGPTTESVLGSKVMEAAFGPTRLTPIQIIVKTPGANGIWDPTVLTGIEKLTQAIAGDWRVSSVSSLRTYLAKLPHDQFVNLKPDYFTPAPPLPAPGQLPQLPNVDVQTVIAVHVARIPVAPAFYSTGRFTIDPGTVLPMSSAAAFEVLSIESGVLTVNAQSQVALIPKGDSDQEAANHNAALGQPFAVNPGDQLVLPSGSIAAFSNDGDQPVVFLGVTIFQVGTTTAPQTSWTDGFPPPDHFQGVTRNVLAGGVATNLPKGAVYIHLDRASTAPGAFFPRHYHIGPETIAVESGEFTIYTAPPSEMTLVNPDGVIQELGFDTAVTMTPGWKALVQFGAIHRAQNLSNAATVILSTRVYAEDQPPFILVGSSEEAAQFANIGGSNDKSVITIIATYDQYDSRHQQLVEDLRHNIIPSIPELKGSNVWVGGDAANFLDFEHTLYGRFPLVVTVVMLLIFVILMMFFQSVFLPLKAIFMNLLSVLATYGILVLIFQDGHGTRLLGFQSLHAVNVITPAILFVILFSLSTDYEVFMLSRVKEYSHATGDNEEAVASGLQHTAGVITAAGLILIGTFGSFATATVVTIKEIGLGLAIGVLIDSTIVRVIMVPATMRLAGNVNWAMPAWLRRIVPELREGPAPGIPLIPIPVPGMALATADSVRQSAGTSRAEAVVMSSSMPAPGQPAPTPAVPPLGRLRSIGQSVGTELIVLPRRSMFRIGRDTASELQLFDPRISRRHAQIEFRNGDYVVTDLNSSNGIYVNGQRIAAATVLRSGDRLEIGNMGTVIFTFELTNASWEAG